MALGEALLVVSSSVTKLVLAGSGCALTYRSLAASNQIAPPTLTALSRVNKQLLIPLFIFVKCAEGIDAETLGRLALVPVLILTFMLIGYVAGHLSVRLSYGPRPALSIATTMCTFSNVLGLPLPLVQSLVAGLAAYQEDTEAQSRCISYLFLANIASSMLMWTFATRMLSPVAAPMLDSSSKSDGPGELEPSHLENGTMDRPGSPLRAGACRGLTAARRMISAVCLSLNRPTVASLLGVTVGSSDTLRALLVERDAPLRSLLDAMDLLGAGAIPLILFVLGGLLSGGPTAVRSAEMPPRTMAAVVVAKLIVVPAANLCATIAFLRIGLLPRTDPLLPLCLVVVGASPTAMNLSAIASLAGTGEREVAQLLFWQYVLAIITMSMYAAIGLLLFLV